MTRPTTPMRSRLATVAGAPPNSAMQQTSTRRCVISVGSSGSGRVFAADHPGCSTGYHRVKTKLS